METDGRGALARREWMAGGGAALAARAGAYSRRRGGLRPPLH